MKTNVLFILLMTFVMSLVWMIASGVFMGMAGAVDVTAVDPMKSALSSLWLVGASFLNVLVVAWFVNRTHLSGINLMFRVFLLLFGVMFFMTQIETLFFNAAIQMPLNVVKATVASGALATLSVAILAVFYREKLGPPRLRTRWIDPRRNITKLLILAAIYVIFYFVFGYYLAWQVPGLREFYTGTTDILPFGSHMAGVLANDIALPVFQIVRGLMWAGLGYAVIAALGNIRLLERAILVGLILSVGLATPLLIPNEFMPEVVRAGHFVELLAENFLFGVLVALFFRPCARP
jgi:hypothetical protein